MDPLLQGTPGDFSARLLGRGCRRAWLVHDAERASLRVSDPLLDELAEHALYAAPDWADHEAVFLEVGLETRALFGAFVHASCRGQSQGGLRHWRYESLGDFLRDGLRLSRGMTRKNALAGLWWGGGKGIIAPPRPADVADPGYRAAVYREYAEFVSSLRGVYVTAEDVGTTPADVARIFEFTRFVTCVPPARGGSGNPSEHTAAGVVCAIEAALEEMGLGTLAGKRAVLQGAGHVGRAVLELLLARDIGEAVISDVNGERVAAAAALGSRVDARRVERGDDSILAERCDVLAPNALGGVLGPDTIPRLETQLVCGAANNPLIDDERDGEALARRGITFVPDYVANRMGIVTCANEQYGSLEGDPAIARHTDPADPESIQATVRRVLARAKQTGVTPVAAANALADEKARAPHPIFGLRTRQIIASLVDGGWERDAADGGVGG